MVVLSAFAQVRAPAGVSAQGSAGQLGTVDTIAGPGFCEARTVLDPQSTAVGALAIDSAGRAYFDVGPSERGRIVTIASLPTSPIVIAELPIHGDSASSPASEGPFAGASRLAADRRGALAATDDRVVHIANRATVAGGGQGGDTTSVGNGDGGPAVAARFSSVLSIATDRDGNLYVADGEDSGGGTFTIRFVNRGDVPVTLYGGTSDEVVVEPGTIETVAGAAGARAGTAAEGARAATLRGAPPALSATGTLVYIASTWPTSAGDAPQSTVRVINVGSTAATVHGVQIQPGSVELVAGGPRGFAGDNGPAREARFGYVPGIAVDGAGSLYLADTEHHRIRRVDESGTITTFAGSGGTAALDGGYNGNRRLATQARLNRPFDVKVAPNGDVYVADRDNGEIRNIDAEGVIHGLGRGLTLRSTCGDHDGRLTGSGVVDTVRPGNPQHVTADIYGSVYFTGRILPQLKRLDASGAVTSVAGFASPESCAPFPPGCPTRDGLPATSVRLDRPTSIAAASRGVYVYDSGHRSVRLANFGRSPIEAHGVQIDPGEIGTVFGDEEARWPGRPPRVATPGVPLSEEVVVAADSTGNLFVADPENGTVWLLDKDGNITTLTSGGSAESPCCARPEAIAATVQGNLYIYDASTNQVWLLNRQPEAVPVHGRSVPPGTVHLVAGNGERGVPSQNSPAIESQLLHPVALATDRVGNVYIADDADHSVLRVDPRGVLTTVAGTGIFGFTGDGTPGPFTTLNEPSGLVVDACGNLIIAEAGNDRLRRLNLAPPCVPTPTDSPSRSGLAKAAAVAVLAGSTVGCIYWSLRRRRHQALQYRAGP